MASKDEQYDVPVELGDWKTRELSEADLEEKPHFCQRIHLGGSASRKSTIFPGHGWVNIIY